MSDIEQGDMVRVVGGMHRGCVGLYCSRATFGGTTGYVDVYIAGKGKKKGRHIKINENLLEKEVEDETVTDRAS